ncbi:CoA transferase [Actinacidiphila sp. DG2A-62]|uniref:CaiB/BaiF CoA transferase family protein n=1 Tax=Actinacidiphila sp. DG2A-62 TaxID=3108821 RepID=UPI002DB5AF04|nr:CoA transferase [Actinacidiphila sp. DG2A-62]MEC3998093.1 CoA transferase [Actinacidiphila sp. DG2A-62]
MTDTSQSDRTPSRPLAGTVVLDLTTALSGPYATLLLGGLGATVVKVENPATGGDSARTNSPYYGPNGLSAARTSETDMSVSMMGRGRNKKSITMNLKDARGRATFLRLARNADIVVENYAAGTADRLGVGYEDVRAVNPSVIYTSISGFGAGGGTAKAMDSIIQALSGVMYTAGEPGTDPVRFGLPVGDLLAPLYAVIGTLAAKLQRDQDGVGQHVDVSMLGALTSLLSTEPFDALAQVGMPLRSGNAVPRLAPFGIFPAKDGQIALCGPTDTFARGVFRAMGRPELIDDERFATRDQRVRHATELHEMVGAWSQGRPRAEAVAALTGQGVPAAEVLEPADALRNPDVLRREEVVELGHPQHGSTGLMGPGVPIRFSYADVRLDQPAPHLGEHTEELLAEIGGLSAQEIAARRREGVV